MRAAAGGSVSTVSSRLTGLVSFMSTQPGAPVPVAAAATDLAEARAAAFHLRLPGTRSPSRAPRAAATSSASEPPRRSRDGARALPAASCRRSRHRRRDVDSSQRRLGRRRRCQDSRRQEQDQSDAVLQRGGGDGQGEGIRRQALPPHGDELYGASARGVQPRSARRQGDTDTPGVVHRGQGRLFLAVRLDRRPYGSPAAQLQPATACVVQKGLQRKRRGAPPGHSTPLRGRSPGPCSQSGERRRRPRLRVLGRHLRLLFVRARPRQLRRRPEIISTVRLCPSPCECPFANAFWNGTQMVYGEGFAAADDVDAHELTHAVTEYSANLYYYMQSGALNESFSDIFGETVDLTNGGGTDTPAVRWLMGEDVPFGAIRNMMNPTPFGDPGKMGDSVLCVADASWRRRRPYQQRRAQPRLRTDGRRRHLQRQHRHRDRPHQGGKDRVPRAHATTFRSGSDFARYYQALRQSCAGSDRPGIVTSSECAEMTQGPGTPLKWAISLPCPPQRPVSPSRSARRAS